MKSEAPVTLAVVLSDGTLYQTAPSALRDSVKARLREAALAAEADALMRLYADVAQAGHADAEDRLISTTPDAAADNGDVRKTPERRKAVKAGLPMRFFGFLPGRGSAWSFTCGGLAGVVMSVLLGFTALHLTPWLTSPASVARTQTTWIEREIVTSHVRSLISARDIDVLSSDQHTVKPWFNGRINYAPPVVDPRAYGFPLFGGRLDYIDERPVAVIVYRYLKHPIDLYVFPNPDDGSAASKVLADTPRLMSKEGYSIIAWKRNGMAFWAITDASMPNLTAFVNAVRSMT